MLVQIATMDDLRKLPSAKEILSARRGPAPIDNFLVHGQLASTDGIWLDVASSKTVPLSTASSMAKYYGFPDLSGAPNDELLEFVRQSHDIARQKSTVSYRLTGFQNPERNFPSPDYVIWAINL